MGGLSFVGSPPFCFLSLLLLTKLAIIRLNDI